MINWKVRIKNPVFWAQIAIAIIAPILASLGLQWTDITSWAIFVDLLRQAASSPVILAAVAVSLWGVINDPTTAGLADSKRALTYAAPYKDGGE